MKLSALLLSCLLLPLSAFADRKPCGGLKGLPCPQGFKCVDDPRDNCDPKKGGADCIGYCVKKKHSVTTVVVTTTTKTKCKHETLCVDYINKCGQTYGGCYDTCTPTTFTPPPCPKTTKCKHATRCVDYINKCGQTYGGCYDTCTPTTFTAPPCPKTTKCKHATVCEDYINKCGQTYGGCYDTCTPTTFTPPPCPATKTP